MNTHIDTLAEWYADAERITVTNLPRAGDALIFPYNAGGYAIEVEEDEWTPNIVMPGEVARILHRAPKPKPAWHDAPAVIADVASHQRQVWVRESDDTYGCAEGYVVDDYELHDVTPLIEAKVTDEMRARAIAAYEDDHGSFAARITATLTAALGIEAE